jgi:hypothetical protein
VKVTTMDDLLFWTWVVGGTPLALALMRQAAAWSRDTVRAAMIARRPAGGERPAGDSWLRWTQA